MLQIMVNEADSVCFASNANAMRQLGEKAAVNRVDATLMPGGSKAGRRIKGQTVKT